MFKAEMVNNRPTVTLWGSTYEQDLDWNFLAEAQERAENLNEEHEYTVEDLK